MWLTVHRNSLWITNQLDVTFVYCFMLRTPQWTHYLPTGFDNLTAATAQYQHVAETLTSHQLLMMGT